MRIVFDGVNRGVGAVGLLCDSLDDMWLVYNLIRVGDRVRCMTLRKVAVGAQGLKSERLLIPLEVEVADLLFDPEQAEIRASGLVCSESEHVRKGSYHTLELTMRVKFDLHKDAWEEGALASLRQARSGVAAGVELVALMLEAGSAQVCCVSRGLTVVRGRVEANIPKKRSGDARHAEAKRRFFESALAALVRASDWESSGGRGAAEAEDSGSRGSGAGGGGAGGGKPPTLLIASPGSIKDEFKLFLEEQVASRPPSELRGLGRAQVLVASAPSCSKHALADALADPIVASALGGLAAAEEVALLGTWQMLLARDPERAQYGWQHCFAAAESAAIEHLLICDRLSRTGTREAREDVEDLLARVRASKGRVSILSSMHPSGELVSQMGGVVAVLRYAVHDLEEAAAAHAGGPGARRAAAASGAGDGAPEGASASLAGHRLQENPAAQAPAPRAAAKDKFGVAFDTDSDCSEDSDLEK